MLQPRHLLGRRQRVPRTRRAGEREPVRITERADAAGIRVVEVQARVRLLRRDRDQARRMERGDAVRGHAAVAVTLLRNLAGAPRMMDEPFDQVEVVAGLERREPTAERPL